MISFFWECTVALRIDNQKNLYSNDFSKQQRVEEQYGPSTLHRTSPAPLTKRDATSGFATMSVKLDMLPSYVLLFLLAAAPPLMVSARPPRFPISSYSKKPCLTFSALSTRVLHTSIFEHRLQTKSVSMVSLTKFSHIRLRRCGRSINGLTSYLSQSCSAPHPSPAQVLGTRSNGLGAPSPAKPVGRSKCWFFVSSNFHQVIRFLTAMQTFAASPLMLRKASHISQKLKTH